MLRILPVNRRVTRQAKIGFVHQRSRLQGVLRAFAPEITRGQTAQLAVDAGKNFIG